MSRWLDARLRASRELPAGEIAESWREEEENEENDDDDVLRTGYQLKKAPKLDVPKEAMELIYRQTLLFMGMIIQNFTVIIL